MRASHVEPAAVLLVARVRVPVVFSVMMGLAPQNVGEDAVLTDVCLGRFARVRVTQRKGPLGCLGALLSCYIYFRLPGCC